MNQSINTDSKNSKEPQQKHRLGTVSIKILGGLNRFYGRVEAAAIKCWEHVIPSHNTLVHKIYRLTERKNSWVKKVKDVVSTLGYSFINSDPVTMIPIHVKHIQQRIHDVAVQEQDSVIPNSPKLDFYKNIYKIQTRAHYVDIISCRSDRSILAKLRVSAHKLTIEKGRYTGNSRTELHCLQYRINTE